MKEKLISILQSVNPKIQEGINLIEDGIIDSFSVVNIVSELESKFDIEIDAEDVLGENFESVESIGLLVEKYLREKK